MADLLDALDEAMNILEELDPNTVRLSIAPAVDVGAHGGPFTRQRNTQDTGFQWTEFGTILIRRATLTAAGITSLPESGQKIEANGTVYKIKFVSPDSSSLTLSCINVY